MSLARYIGPQIARRFYASASHGAVSHGHGGKDVGKVHPLFNDHPVAPVATYDDFPVPVLSFKEGYEKPQKAFNLLLAASVSAFVLYSLFFWGTDVLGIEQGRAPKWYRYRKIGKGLGDID